MNTPQLTSPIITASALKALPVESYVLIDARSNAKAVTQYLEGHLPGALHVYLDRDLSQKPTDIAEGGRNPLPDIFSFTQLLGRLGIEPTSKVVVYDDKSGANAAARFWWMLRAVGHQSVAVLNGGLPAALKEGFTLTTDIPQPTPVAPYPATQWLLRTATIETVAAVSTESNHVVIDVRDAYRYRGESEPKDPIAGHIPGAVNVPFSTNMTEDGQLLESEELAKLYKEVIGDRPIENVIVHCGSGVTACNTLLALEHAGLTGAQLYVGSWSEWSRSGQPVATGDQP